MNHLAKMTPEEREAAQRKRKEQADYYKSLDTRQEFADENYWRELATKHKVKLPIYYFPADIKRVQKCVEGKSKKFDGADHNLITVYEFKSKGYRSFKADSVLEIKAQGDAYE